MATIKVTQQPENEVPAEVIAQAIVDIAKAMWDINRSRLPREAIVTLIADKSGVPKTQIRIVLNHLRDLEQNWLKPKS